MKKAQENLKKLLEEACECVNELFDVDINPSEFQLTISKRIGIRIYGRANVVEKTIEIDSKLLRKYKNKPGCLRGVLAEEITHIVRDEILREKGIQTDCVVEEFFAHLAYLSAGGEEKGEKIMKYYLKHLFREFEVEEVEKGVEKIKNFVELSFERLKNLLNLGDENLLSKEYFKFLKSFDGKIDKIANKLPVTAWKLLDELLDTLKYCNSKILGRKVEENLGVYQPNLKSVKTYIQATLECLKKTAKDIVFYSLLEVEEADPYLFNIKAHAIGYICAEKLFNEREKWKSWFYSKNQEAIREELEKIFWEEVEKYKAWKKDKKQV